MKYRCIAGGHISPGHQLIIDAIPVFAGVLRGHVLECPDGSWLVSSLKRDWAARAFELLPEEVKELI